MSDTAVMGALGGLARSASAVLVGVVIASAGSADATAAAEPGGSTIVLPAAISADRGAAVAAADLHAGRSQAAPKLAAPERATPARAVQVADDGENGDRGWGWGPSRIIWGALGWLGLVVVAAILLRRLASRRR
ncbi:hypothetical protein [Jiangella asiatica]|uniref:Uncharacterized protein n=1 Tax=Jiangella asiatica TaxID=2530372 RepID=A0A4R5DBX5_9ACTN|nr:hypothetical protein [Jiangella asiatica]TDE09084.1 hypothetical protein E1269_15320 [Jiangella asiatica]